MSYTLSKTIHILLPHPLLFNQCFQLPDTCMISHRHHKNIENTLILGVDTNTICVLKCNKSI